MQFQYKNITNPSLSSEEKLMKAITFCSKAILGVGSRLIEQQIRDLKQIFHSTEEAFQVAPTTLDDNNNMTKQPLMRVQMAQPPRVKVGMSQQEPMPPMVPVNQEQSPLGLLARKGELLQHITHSMMAQIKTPIFPPALARAFNSPTGNASQETARLSIGLGFAIVIIIKKSG